MARSRRRPHAGDAPGGGVGERALRCRCGEAKPINHGALTIPSNIYGIPAISIPIGQAADGLPVGLQVLAPHFQEQVLLDLALAMERERPWPLVAPTAPV